MPRLRFLFEPATFGLGVALFFNTTCVEIYVAWWVVALELPDATC